MSLEKGSTVILRAGILGRTLDPERKCNSRVPGAHHDCFQLIGLCLATRAGGGSFQFS